MQDGSDPAWYLLDTSRAIKPLIWQERESYEFQSITGSSDPYVFMNDEHLYGVRARVNAGFGLWQKSSVDRCQLRRRTRGNDGLSKRWRAGFWHQPDSPCGASRVGRPGAENREHGNQ